MTPVEAVLPAGAADRLGVAAGATLPIRDRISGRPADVRVVGTFRADDPREAFWFASPLELDGFQQQTFRVYGPLVVDRADFTRRFSGVGATQRWRVGLDPATVTAAQLAPLAGRVRTLTMQQLGSSAGNPLVVDAAVTTGLPALLDQVGSAVLVSGSTIVVPVLQLLVLAGIGLLLVAGLIVDHRRVETALVRARGGSTGQLAGWSLRETALLVLPAVTVAPLLALSVLQVVARSGALKRADVALSVQLGPAAWAAAGVGGLLCALACWCRCCAPGGRRSRSSRPGRAWAGWRWRGAPAPTWCCWWRRWWATCSCAATPAR